MRTRILGLLCLAAVLPALPASAHAGGRAQLFIASASAVPENGGWAISTLLRDLDSGTAEPGFAVDVSGTGPSGAAFGPIALADTEGAGRYQTTLPALADGNWALTVRAAEVPGGKAALPLKRTWNVTLRPGQALDLARARSSYGGEGSGPNAIPLGLAIAAAAALFLLTGARLGRHRRATVSVR